MIKKLRQSLYLKLFLSFLATCVLFFVILALFWSSHFSDLVYRDKRQLLMDRSEDMVQIVENWQEESLSSRELRFAVRLISRSFNGQIWIVDNRGRIFLSNDMMREGQSIPDNLQPALAKALSNNSDFLIGQLPVPEAGRQPNNPAPPDSFLTYYMPVMLNGSLMAVFFHTPVEDITDVIAAMRWNIWVPLLFCLLAVGIILYIISRKLAGPLREMNRASLALAADRNFSIRVPEGAEDEVGQLAKSFNFMMEELGSWEDSRQEFLANVSHELRSPLAALRGMIVAMKDHVIPEEQRPHYLEICDSEVQRLGRLVDELLDLARIQNSSDVYDFSVIQAVDKTCEVIELLAPVMKSKGLLFKLETDEAIRNQAWVRLDPDRYAQILNNLLHNAIKFTPEGKLITVRTQIIAKQFEIVVSDTGKGMTMEETRRIWDRFYKADHSRSGAVGGGTGLGLTIVKHLVSGMNGHISVHSKPGSGTSFTVRFPICNKTAV